MKILHLISSPRGAASFSTQLGEAIVQKLQQANQGSTVTTRNLAAHPFPHLEEAHIQSFYTPAESRSPESIEAVKHSDDAIAQLNSADVIVISAGMYNFTITSTLKAWIDHIVRAGVTFTHNDEGIEGLVKNKKVYLAMSSGGIYSEGPMAAYDFVAPYLKSTLGFLGMTDVTTYRAEGLNVPGLKEEALAKGIASIQI